jgi:hypothetical protein
MAEQLENWGKMAAFMHMTGRVPAAYADQPGKRYIARCGRDMRGNVLSIREAVKYCTCISNRLANGQNLT